MVGFGETASNQFFVNPNPFETCLFLGRSLTFYDCNFLFINLELSEQIEIFNNPTDWAPLGNTLTNNEHSFIGSLQETSISDAIAEFM